MRKTFLKVSLLAVLGVGMSASFTSCKDYDNDIDNLQEQINSMNERLKAIEDLVKSGSVITSCTPTANGIHIVLSNGSAYDINNGKDGANGTDGKDGKDAAVWTIEKTANGYFWAYQEAGKDKVVTEYPAQGPAGENGENGAPGTNGENGAPGNYYQPNPETGCFDLVDGATGEVIKQTEISYLGEAGKSGITAVDNGDTITIFGLKDAEGKDLDPVTIWKTMLVKGLVVMPELYLTGTEAVRYEMAQWKRIQQTVNTKKDTKTTEGGAVIAAGQPEKTEQTPDWMNLDWSPYSISTINYHLNPNDANIDKLNWELLIDDIEVAESRATNVSGVVLSAEKTSKGDLKVTYKLDGPLAPHDKNQPWWGTVDSHNKWTFMALQAVQTNNENAVVTSDNVAVLPVKVYFNNLVVDKNSWAKDPAVVFATADAAIEKDINEPTVTSTPTNAILEVPYNANYDLAAHTYISVTKICDLIQDENSTTDKAETKTGYMTIAEAQARYGLTPAFHNVEYTITGLTTSENMFGAINDKGVFTPMYIDKDGQQVPAVGTEAGRSAVGRRPVIYITLSSDKGVVLAGFVKLVISDNTTKLDHEVVLGSTQAPYICNWSHESNWEAITGKVYEELGLTPKEFANTYALAEDGAAYVKDGDNFIKVPGNRDFYNGVADYGTFTWTPGAQVVNGAQTQILKLTISAKQWETWYLEWANWLGNFAPNVTTEPVTKTIYAKFVDVKYPDHVLYMGFDVTAVGTPAADYEGKIPQMWTSDKTTGLINPAVPGQTGNGTNANTVPAYTGFPYASSMGSWFGALWEGGVPTPVAKAPYNWTNEDGAFYLTPVIANYNFADNQPNAVGLSGTEYEVGPFQWIQVGNDWKQDKHALYARIYDENGNAITQPIAAITSSTPNNTGTSNISFYNEDAVMDVISILPSYIAYRDGSVVLPSAGQWVGTSTKNYASFACDIVNAKPFNKANPAVTFNIEMVVKYGQKGFATTGENGCLLTIPGVYTFKMGIGQPLKIEQPKNTGTLQDGNTSKQTVKVSTLFSVKDWQNSNLWTVNSKGEVKLTTAGKFWGSDATDFSVSKVWPNNKPAGCDLKKNLATHAGITIKANEALVSTTNDLASATKKFVDVYKDKVLKLQGTYVDAATNSVDNITFDQLSGVELTWLNEGTAVVDNIYIFVPVYINYIWGQEILLGYAGVTVQPTLGGN